MVAMGVPKSLHGRVDKNVLLKSILSQLESECALQTEAAYTSREEATDEESKAEDRYDMRSQSAAYLAAGQARMAGELADAIAAWRSLVVRPFGPEETIALGALVVLEGGAGQVHYLLGPHSGGLEARDGMSSATVVTGSSPLGRQLAGRRRGDEIFLPGRPKPLRYVVASVE